MTKNWHTKKKILKLIGKKVKTPGEISKELGLAPSTVSEHLEGLEKIGAVKKVDNPHIKKWKYYSLNPSFNINAMGNDSSRMPLIAATLVIALFLCAFAFTTFGMPTVTAANQVAFRLTDPPKVPNGTQALNITYSSIQAHVAGSGNVSGWISGSGSGTIDLMNLINTSQVIGTGKIPENASIDSVRFSVSSAEIVVNSTEYNVTVPSGQFTASVTGSGTVNSSSSILIDLSPVVAAIYTENSTVFVMVPSLRAVVVGNGKSAFRIGDTKPLSHDDVDVLNNTVPKISITGATLSVVGNSTQLEVTVKNNANSSVTLDNVELFGTPSVFIAPNSVYPMWANSTRGLNINERPNLTGFNETPYLMAFNASQEMLNASHGRYNGSDFNASQVMPLLPLPPPPFSGEDGQGSVGVNEMQNGGFFWKGRIDGVNVTSVGDWGAVKGGEMPNFSASQSQDLGRMVKIGAQARMLQVLNFIVAKNGTLVLPLISGRIEPMRPVVCENCFGSLSNQGYVLQPGASETLTFTGNLLYLNGQMKLTPVIGNKYLIEVMGDRGVEAHINVTAS